jgi:hypothetical protein
MKIQIEYGNGYEEILYKNTWDFILGFGTLILIFFFFGIIPGMLYALFLIAVFGLSEGLSEKVTINKRFNTITCETLLGLGKTKKLKFSDILQVKIFRENHTEYGSNDLSLIFRDGKKNYRFYSEYKGTENIGIRIAKTIGIDCISIIDYGEPTMLYEAKSKSDIPEPENEPIPKDLHNQLLRLEHG